jgi:hypothetical protein
MPVAAVAVETRQPRLLVDLVAVALAALATDRTARLAQQIQVAAVAVLVCSFPQVLSSHRAETVVLVL